MTDPITKVSAQIGITLDKAERKLTPAQYDELVTWVLQRLDQIATKPRD